MLIPVYPAPPDPPVWCMPCGRSHYTPWCWSVMENSHSMTSPKASGKNIRESVRMRETHRDGNDSKRKWHSLLHWCHFCPRVPWAPPPSMFQCPFPSGTHSGLLHSLAPHQTPRADTPGYSGRCALAYQKHLSSSIACFLSPLLADITCWSADYTTLADNVLFICWKLWAN